MAEVEPGTILQGQYEIQAKRGEGGMALLYRAFDRQRRVPVAIKLMKADFAEDPLFIEKFKREARSLQRLQHPNIVRFYELGEDGPLVFMVLDYIDGGTLRSVIKQRGRPFIPGEVVHYLQPICAALSYAHSQGVVHCDIKPANIMLDRHGKVFVTDFGIARLSESATVTFSTPGTALYMAPEQWRGGSDIHPSTDVYALGVMLYEMLTGTYPFTGGSGQTQGHTREKIMREHLTAQPPRASQLNPKLGPELDTVLLRCLEKDPQQRFQNADELLTAFQSRVNPSQLVAEVALGSASAGAPPDRSVARQQPAGRSAIYLLAVGAGLVALFGWVALAARGQSRTAISATSVLAGAAATATMSSAETQVPATVPAVAPPTPANSPVTASAALTEPAAQTVGRDGMILLRVPAGDFWMGAATSDLVALPDERPQHRVYLNTFWIDQTEVTNVMYATFLNAQNAWPALGWLNSTNTDTQITHDNGSWQVSPGFERYPVINVHYDGARAYCQWAGRRLPSEAEWEKAARGADGRLYPWGNQPPTGSLANFADSSTGAATAANDGRARTAPVGSYPAGASPYGALDMAGNVWEWLADWYAPDYYSSSPSVDPRGPSDTGARVLRGGSWHGGPEYLRTTKRGAPVPAATTNDDFGFRCAANDPPGTAAP